MTDLSIVLEEIKEDSDAIMAGEIVFNQMVENLVNVLSGE